MIDAMKRPWLAVIGVVLLLVAGGFLTLFYSPAPYWAASFLLGKIGIEVNGVAGSLTSGIHVDRLSFGNEGNSFTLENFTLRYEGLWDFYFKRKPLEISELTMARVVIKARTESGAAAGTVAAVEPSSQGQRRVHIAKFDIGTVVLDIPSLSVPFQIDNWHIRNLSSVGGKLDFESFSVRSNMLDLDLAHGPPHPTLKETPTSTDVAVALILKPTYFSWLKAPLSLGGRMRVDNGEFDRSAFILSAFGDKASLKFNAAGLLALNAHDLDLTDFLTGPLPLRRIQADVTLGPDCRDLTTLRINSGELGLGSTSLNVVPGPVLERVAGSDKLRFHVAAISRGEGRRFSAEVSNGDPSGAPGSLKLELSSVPKLPDDELLAQLLFSKPYSMLTDEERQVLASRKAGITFKDRKE
jgi:hypothetical protein